jgi:ATP-dependent helicase/nuclease subunit B
MLAKTMQQFFLPWNAPLLDQVVSHLLQTCTEPPISSAASCAGNLSLDRKVFVFPSERSGRDFLRMLALKCHHASIFLFPPRIITLQELAPLLCPLPLSPFPTDLEELLLTIKAARRTESFKNTLRNAADLIAIRKELTAYRLTLHSVTKALDEQDAPDTIIKKWLQLVEIEATYLNSLKNHDLNEPSFTDKNSFYLELCEEDTSSVKSKHLDQSTTIISNVTLVGCCAIQPLLVRLLEVSNVPCSVYIHAPEEKSSFFDLWGHVNVQAWITETSPLHPEEVIVTNESYEQAIVTACWLKGATNKLTPQSVTLAVCDRELVDQLTVEVASADLVANSAIGISVADSSLGQLIKVLLRLEHLCGRDAFNELLQNSDIRYWLTQLNDHNDFTIATGTLCAEWNTYRRQHLPGPAATTHTLSTDAPRVTQYQHLNASLARLLELFDPFFQAEANDDSLRQAGPVALREILQTIYSDLPATAPAFGPLSIVNSLLDELTTSPVRLPLSMSETLALILKHITAVMLSNSSASLAEAEIVGWLDLALDRSPIACVLSLNEEFLPEASTENIFLTETIREKLGLATNKSRLARDKYWLTSIKYSKHNALFLASRKNTKGDSTLLSRLLLESEPTKTARSLLNFFESSFKAPVIYCANISKSYRTPEPPQERSILQEIPATSLGLYARSPYVFYLRYILSIYPPRTIARELDGATFGSVIHSILRELVEFELKNGFDYEALERYIDKKIISFCNKEFGFLAYPVVKIQLDQMAIRLKQFLNTLSVHRTEGWKTIALEKRIIAPITLANGKVSTLQIKGQIDRIDYNPDLNELRIYDYKSSETPLSAHQSHRAKEEWIDFQLPAYRQLVLASLPLFGIKNPHISLALFNLPQQRLGVKESVATWQEEELEQADQKMYSILTCIEQKQFEEINKTNCPLEWTF